MEVYPQAGEVYWAVESPEPQHRWIVVSNERFNRGNRVTVVPTTSTHFDRRSKLSTSVVLARGSYGCFTKDCVAQAERVATVPKAAIDLEAGPLTIIDPAKMRELIIAIGIVISAECEPMAEPV